MPPILLPAMAEEVWHDGVVILGLRGVYLITESSDLLNFAHLINPDDGVGRISHDADELVDRVGQFLFARDFPTIKEVFKQVDHE